MSANKVPRTVDGVVQWRCSRCKDWKKADEFYTHRAGPNGLRSACKVCLRKCAGAQYQKARDKNLEYARQYRREFPERVRKANADHHQRNKAKRLNANAEWREANTDHLRSYRRSHMEEHPETYAARAAVNNAIRAGKLVRPAECDVCGTTAGRINGHHDSYEKDRWLVVTWMCDTCHAFTHARRKEQANAAKQHRMD